MQMDTLEDDNLGLTDDEEEEWWKLALEDGASDENDEE